jgi:hypothetical protein
MSFSATISKKTVVLALLLAAAGLTLVGNWAAGDLRSLAQMAMLPLSQPGTGLALTIRERVDELSPPSGRWQRKLVEARTKAEHLQYDLDAVRARFAEHMRIDHEEKETRYGILNGFPCELVAARVVAGQSLPYGDTRVLRASAAKPGAYVTTVDLLTDRAKSLPEDLLALDTMDTKALVGRIVSSGMATAQLQLVTDGDFQIGAMIWRDPNLHREIDTAHRREPLTATNNQYIPTTIRGDGRGGMIATDVFKSHNVLPGDWIGTDGRSKFMPQRIRIGRVAAVKPDPRNAGLVALSITPVADLASLRDVYIVVPMPDSRTGAKN